MTRKKARQTVHQLKLSDHVYQRVNPWNQGTVTDIDSVSFRVTYDSYGRKRGEPRTRIRYPIRYQEDFLIGQPNPDLLIWEKELKDVPSDGTD